MHNLRPAALFTALESVDFSANPPTIDVLDMLAAWEAKPERGRAMLRKISYKTLDRQTKNPATDPITDVLAYFVPMRASFAGNEHFDYFTAYLETLREGWRHGLAGLTASRYGPGLKELAEHLLDFAGAPEGAAGAAVHCVIGQVLSLVDRDAAREHFNAIHEGGHASLVAFFYWDTGALTYFSADEIHVASGAQDVETVLRSFTFAAAAPASETAIAVSVDANFFRIYGPWLYFYAQQLPGIDFNFILCAAPDEAAGLIRDGAAFAGALSGMNRGPVPSNIHFHTVPVPAFAQNPMTFYACARFFALPELLARYSNVYLMDADLYLQDNPTAFLKSLQGVTFSAPDTTSAAALSPWRRHMAGNIAANRELLGTSFLTDLHAYLVHGLRQPASWMLDQNALSYAIERADSGIVEPLNRYKRPFVTSGFMKTWETNYRAAVRS